MFRGACFRTGKKFGYTVSRWEWWMGWKRIPEGGLYFIERGMRVNFSVYEDCVYAYLCMAELLKRWKDAGNGEARQFPCLSRERERFY